MSDDVRCAEQVTLHLIRHRALLERRKLGITPWQEDIGYGMPYLPVQETSRKQSRTMMWDQKLVYNERDIGYGMHRWHIHETYRKQ